MPVSKCSKQIKKKKPKKLHNEKGMPKGHRSQKKELPTPNLETFEQQNEVVLIIIQGIRQTPVSPYWCVCALDSLCPWHDVTRRVLYLCGRPPKPHTPRESWEKQETSSNRGVPWDIPEQFSSKPSRSPKTRKACETIIAQRSLRRCDDWLSRGALDRVLE